MVRFFRKVIDHVLAGNNDIQSFYPGWENIRQRWIAERISRDNGRVQDAEQSSRNVVMV
jgi:hypothetical protein